MSRTPLTLLNEFLLNEAAPLPPDAKAVLDKAIAGKIKKALGVDLKLTSSRASPVSYSASFLNDDGLQHRLEILMHGDSWRVELEAYPFGYRGSRSRSDTIGTAQAKTINDALKQLKKVD